MSYRERAIAILKLAGQELISQAKEFVPDVHAIRELSVCIRIPSLSDDEFRIPEISVDVDLYPRREVISMYHSLYQIQKTTEEATNEKT